MSFGFLKRYSTIIVSIRNVLFHLADLHLEIAIQARYRKKQLEGRAIVGRNKERTNTCKRITLSSNQTREEQTQLITIYLLVSALPNSVVKKVNQKIASIVLLVFCAFFFDSVEINVQ